VRDCTYTPRVDGGSWQPNPQPVSGMCLEVDRTMSQTSLPSSLPVSDLDDGGSEGPRLICPRCGADLSSDESFASARVCGFCGFHDRESARAAIQRLVDPGSFRERDLHLFSSDPLRFEDGTAYRDRLQALRSETGESDALVTGTARIGGHDIAIAALDFGFLGGSMGVVVGWASNET
jgi:acetyl-CoA carboxylase beta subunit